jgi:hypothetical protein
MKITALWDVTSCNLVDIYRHLSEICGLHYQVRKKCWWKFLCYYYWSKMFLRNVRICWSDCIPSPIGKQLCAIPAYSEDRKQHAVSQIQCCVISGFRREKGDNCNLLSYCAASSGNFWPTFWDTLSVPSSGFKNTNLVFWSTEADVLIVDSVLCRHDRRTLREEGLKVVTLKITHFGAWRGVVWSKQCVPNHKASRS